MLVKRADAFQISGDAELRVRAVKFPFFTPLVDAKLTKGGNTFRHRGSYRKVELGLLGQGISYGLYQTLVGIGLRFDVDPTENLDLRQVAYIFALSLCRQDLATLSALGETGTERTIEAMRTLCARGYAGLETVDGQWFVLTPKGATTKEMLDGEPQYSDIRSATLRKVTEICSARLMQDLGSGRNST